MTQVNSPVLPVAAHEHKSCYLLDHVFSPIPQLNFSYLRVNGVSIEKNRCEFFSFSQKDVTV